MIKFKLAGKSILEVCICGLLKLICRIVDLDDKNYRRITFGCDVIKVFKVSSDVLRAMLDAFLTARSRFHNRH